MTTRLRTANLEAETEVEEGVGDVPVLWVHDAGEVGAGAIEEAPLLSRGRGLTK